jgi:predicted nucleic acid-binding protein
MKCYIDTNILIEYLYRNHISEKARKDTICCKLIDKGAEGEYEIFISDYTIIEISQHFTDYFLMLKSIEDGYVFSSLRADV